MTRKIPQFDIDFFPATALVNARDIPALQTSATQTLALTSTEACLEAIRSHAPDPSIFDDSPPFIFAAQISNNSRDFYNTRMDVSTTLKNFVEDAINGVVFLDSHQHSEKLGRSFAAVLVEKENDVAEVYAAFYTIPDAGSANNTTNDLIRRIRSGIEKDVSVGFMPGENFMMRCSVCGLDMFRNWDCEHYAGMNTKVWDDDQEEWREVKVYATVIDARLAEASGVHKGATNNAAIAKAKYLAERGVFKESEIRMLEQQLRTALPIKKSFANNFKRENADDSDEESNFNSEGENNMPQDTEKPKISESIIRTCRSLGLLKDDESLTSTEDAMTRFATEMKRLRSVETQHDQFKTDEIADAIKEGIRAVGKDFDKERYDRFFESMSLTDIRKFKLDWTKEADAKLGSNNSRRSVDDVEETDEGEENESDSDETTDEERAAMTKEEKDKADKKKKDAKRNVRSFDDSFANTVF